MKFSINLFDWRTYWAGLNIFYLFLKGWITVDLPGLIKDRVKCSGSCSRK